MRRIGWLGMAFVLCSVAGCTALPPPEGRSVSRALPAEATADTVLGRAVEARAAREPAGRSGIHPMLDPREAFAARLLLARAAERTLDVQYYIWRDDLTGTLLLDALRDAADRGVRVRLLLDDNGTTGMDDTLVTLDANPNIDVRLFNPFRHRDFKWLGYLTDFSRANRRMHNKSFTADNQAAIIGGRNVGDEYFGADDGILFADLDVLAVGPVVQALSRDFDRYWASDSSYPVADVVDDVAPDDSSSLAARARALETAPEARAYQEALERSALIRRLETGNLSLEWADVELLSDDPAKGLGQASSDSLVLSHIMALAEASDRTFLLVSPYFVPTDAGSEIFRQMAARGIQVQVLTNSMAATDVLAVHAGYTRQRRTLLESGVTLYELRRQHSAAGRQVGLFGSSGASLHAKTFALDGQRLFVGSFNFDPRSANLNTELGFVIESPALAAQMAALFEEDIPRLAYRVRLDRDGDMEWIALDGDRREIYRHEPNSTWWQRGTVWLISKLPVEWLL
ncbi:phospholipase D family protein [Salinicola avicenniae]|uniref:phospholipase D family protein n=1 Tax=Salinicola avicenniae TaxID=2916836 RepID=UPI002073BCBC|nr:MULTISPECIES: phospholipase D family protein [unclassified Salinicola]